MVADKQERQTANVIIKNGEKTEWHT